MEKKWHLLGLIDWMLEVVILTDGLMGHAIVEGARFSMPWPWLTGLKRGNALACLCVCVCVCVSACQHHAVPCLLLATNIWMMNSCCSDIFVLKNDDIEFLVALYNRRKGNGGAFSSVFLGLPHVSNLITDYLNVNERNFGTNFIKVLNIVILFTINHNILGFRWDELKLVCVFLSIKCFFSNAVVCLFWWVIA